MVQARRREILIASGALLAAPLASYSQAPQAVRRIGLLAPFPDADPRRKRVQEALRRELAQLGYEEGKNLVIEWRFALKGDKLLRLAEELVRLRVELIVALANEAVKQASRATRTIPIVMWHATHPVENGWIKSLARPGGNITGAMWGDPEHNTKIFELIREAAPRAKRIAVTFNPTYPFAQSWLDGYDRAASVLGMTLQYFPIARAEDIDPALGRVAAVRPDVLYVSAEAVQNAHARKIAAFAIERKLMMVSNVGDLVVEGGFLCLQPDGAAIIARVASYVDRILRGAKPADLPVELPAKYVLLINAKTARAIGYKIPPSLLARANRVIE